MGGRMAICWPLCALAVSCSLSGADYCVHLCMIMCTCVSGVAWVLCNMTLLCVLGLNAGFVRGCWGYVVVVRIVYG